MQVDSKRTNYHPHHFFNYPFTLISLPKRSFISKPLHQPTAYEVYCPISCKKIKIGASKKLDAGQSQTGLRIHKQAIQFNTTSNRWITTIFNNNIKYLVNKHPPNKKDNKNVQGSEWSAYVEASEKGNYAIFNPYCVIPDEPLSLYTFSPLIKIEKQLQIQDKFKPLSELGKDEKIEEIKIGKNIIYFKQSQLGSFIGTNQFFDDSVNGTITIKHPNDSTKVWIVSVDQAFKIVQDNKHFWLSQLSLQIETQVKSIPIEQIHFNLDQIYQKIGFYLNIQEQIRAKLMNTGGLKKLYEHFSYHPRLYSAFNRLASFVNYGITKFNTVLLAELGFYNKSDMLQDLSFYEYPQIPIQSAEDPAYLSEHELRKRLFPFSRTERQLPFPNISLNVTINSLLHQTVSEKKIIFRDQRDHYILFVDEDYNASIWSTSLFPTKLYQFNANSEQEKSKTSIVLQQIEILENLPNVEKDQSILSSLFDEPAPPPKEVKPVEIQPDQSMLDQMVQMGYGINLIKKSLIAVKNQSVPAAIDMIDTLIGEQKKKKAEKRKEWSCPSCTYLNKADNDTCQMCGQLCDLVDQAEKQRQKLQKQAQQQLQKKKEEQRLQIQKQKQQEKIKKQIEELQRQNKQRQKEELLKKSRLVSAQLLNHKSSPIDPFFIILIFWNQQANKSLLKIVRIGLQRGYFSKFYRLEEKNILVGNTKHTPLAQSFESYQQIAKQSIDAIEWGIRLIEPSKPNQWIISEIKEIDLQHKLIELKVVNQTQFTAKGDDKIVHYNISIKDDLKVVSFQVTQVQNLHPSKEQLVEHSIIQTDDKIQVKSGQNVELDQKVSEIFVEILQHLPIGKWQSNPNLNSKITVQGRLEGEVIMNQFIPLSIDHFEGSTFSGKHYSTTILEKSPNLYISNYPKTNFTFKHSNCKQMFIEQIVIISSSKKLQRIFSIFEGLIFTANEPTWFHLAKERFSKFSKSDYQNWLSNKRAKNDQREFWEPVGFFQIENETQIQLDFKRSAKYVFLLPTTIKNSPDKKKDEVYAIKIDFFGVKGRIEQQKSQQNWISLFKNEGNSSCEATIFNQINGEEVAIDSSNVIVKRVGNINSFHYLPQDSTIFEKLPVSATTAFSIRLRNNNHKKVLKIQSQFAKRITVRLNRQVAVDIADSASISSFKDLSKAQNELTIQQLKKIAQALDINELIVLILKSDIDSSRYESLINKIGDSVSFKEHLFNKIIEFIPSLCNEEIQITEPGFKLFVTLYEKNIAIQMEHSFSANVSALKKITQYVSENRNKNYNLLRSKYNIEELVLQTSLFSKDYYRHVYPNYIEEPPKPLANLEPAGPINHTLWIEQITPYLYHQYIDLRQTRKVQTIKFFVPKITQVNFRQKLLINVWSVNDLGDRLLYSRYFHEELLVQLGVNGFKDNEIYKGESLNYLTISDLQVEARIIKVQISYLLLTSEPHQKYKQVAQKFYLIPLVESKPIATSTVNVSKQLQKLSSFPQQPKHFYVFQRLPPAKYLTEGNRSIFHVFEFPVVELASVKKQYKQIVDKITTNIMDETIVRECVKSMKISNYEFNKKGIDFAYTYLICVMNLNRKFSTELKVSVDLMLQLFDNFVVYQSGPIMKKTFAFLQQTYKRLTNLQKATFIDALINKYLLNLQNLPTLKVSQKYSPLKVIQKLQQFDLPIANLLNKVQKYDKKSLKLILIKVIFTVATTNGAGHLELYNIETGKFTTNYGLIDLINGSFRTCLWILDNVQGIKQQAISDGLDLLLLFLSSDLAPFSADQRIQAVRTFIQHFDEQKLWKLVFLTLKMKSQILQEKINKLFTVLTANLTTNFRKSINDMVQQIIVKRPESIYVQINQQLTEQQWMNHLQTTLELISMTKDSLFLDNQTALKLLELPLTPTLWSLALHIIPRNDQILISIIKNFKKQYYNSLGKEITKFCEPLTGIPSLQSIHVNWLDIVRKIRIEGKNVFQLFIEQLELCSFGGRQGLTMATVSEVKQLEITSQFIKLVLQNKTLNKSNFNEENIQKLILWYFLNKSKEKGQSPATDKILFLSQSVATLFKKMTEHQEIVKLSIKCLLKLRRDSEVIQRNFEEKRIPIHSALTLNKRFCECFEELLTLFMTNDSLCSYFAFDLHGLEHILRSMDINSSQQILAGSNNISLLPDEELLLAEKLIATKASKQLIPSEIKQLDDLKEQQFANNVKLVPGANPATLVATNVDWTAYKKGNKAKVLFLPLTETSTYHEHPVFIQLAKTAEIRSIKIGFPAASYEFNDKLVVTPSSVVVEGSLNGSSYEPIGQMDYIQDDAYIMNGVQVWVLNCQKITGLSNISNAVQSLGLHKARYLKLTVKRPTVAFIEGQYSQLNGKNYNTLGCSISFLSVTGDDCDKLPFTLIESCKQISKRSSLNILAYLLNENNSLTMKRISNDESFSSLIRDRFKKIREYMNKYQEVMPAIIYLIGAGNHQLGDWIVNYFLEEGGGDLQARIINQIITSTPEKAFQRIKLFLRSILRKLKTISIQSQIQSGLLYNEQIFFMQSFCKTLEECYEMGISKGVLEVEKTDIDNIISIYDTKYSSPEIKSLLKLLIHLLHIKEPLSLSNSLTEPAMDLIWSNCSELKSHFYNLMAGLLISRKASTWLKADNWKKVNSLIDSIYSSITHKQFKNLKLQLFLLGQISYHEAEYLLTQNVHIQFYQRIKQAAHQDQDIIDAVLRVIRNIVLGNQVQEKKIAQSLFDDVGLLVKRRDHFLQKLYVGLLGSESEVMIHITGVDLHTSSKKEAAINSKFLTKKNQKILLEKISKKYKYSLMGEINTEIKAENQDLFLKAFACSSILLLIRFKVNQNIHTIAIYSPCASKRNQQGDYFWQEIISYDKTGFICFLEQAKPFFISNEKQEAMLGNIYGGDQQQENAAMFYDDSQQIITFSFNTNQSSVPKLILNKFKKELDLQLTSNTLDQDFEGYSFIGLEFWELRVPNAVQVTDSKISNLLSKSNQARPPFSYYRHSPIYVFPANITLNKFMSILGLKGTCTTKNKPLSSSNILSQLERGSDDFIIDLQIQSQQENKEDKQEISQIGYIPVMNIFNYFSSLQGVNQVLRLGTESLKDWKKLDRKKNFQHYMQQLRSFINLPNFFNLFIKNQQYVTLLFEVASGLPDDENSTRNWQEEYVNNFRFIYKIVSDIFKYDRSPQLRHMDKYADFVDVILDKLSEITKEAPRILKEQEVKQQQVEISSIPLAKVKSEDRKRKKKGIGYGADNQNNSKWSASQWLQARKNVSQQTLRVISIIVSFLDCQKPLTDDRLLEIIKQSCLLPILESNLRSGSLLDISKQSELFKQYLHIVRLLSGHPSTIQCLLDLQKKYKPQQSESIYSLLGKLNNIAQIFTECLKSGKEASGSNEAAQGISLDIQRTFSIVDKAVKNLKKRGKSMTIKELDNMPVPQAYRILLSELRFGYVNLKEGAAYKHAHSSSISTNTPSTSKILRLSQELADLSSSLPCQNTNSIFVRCDKSRIDVINILIFGSKDTPYANGAFTFDVYCDDSYPNNPPKMLITTTGQGKIRFNPNLYSCGKVCLSLLGTWRGSASENWDPKVSTLLQLFISTQGITMSDDVYFNEPGFEGEQGTQEGDRKNQAYSNIVRLGNVRYAMNAQLKNPPKGFEEVVKRHFYIKRKEILQECQKWVEYAEKRQASYNGLVNDHNSSWCAELKQSKTKYRQLLVKEIDELRETLNSMTPPNLKQSEQQEQPFQKQKAKERQQVKSEHVKLEEVDVSYGNEEKEIKKYQQHVMHDRWSRYIGAMGLQAVKKQAESSVLLIGLKSLGLETAKNLVLSGLKKLTIFQPQNIEDHSEHFFMSNVKSGSIKQCIYKIKQLNPYMVVEQAQVLPPLEKYSVVVSTSHYEQSLQLSTLCRDAGVKFIWAESKGVYGMFFADLGLHEVNDDNGQQPFQGMIKSITTGEESLVTLLDGMRHPYQDGDYIVLSRVEGMELEKEVMEEKSEAQLFFEKQSNEKVNGINNTVFKIKVINWNSFLIGDTRNYTPYKGNGLCRNIKIPRKIQFEPLSKCSKQFEKTVDPNMGMYDFEKMGDNQSIFLCFQALSTFRTSQKSSPKNWVLNDADKFLNILKQIITPLQKTEEQVTKILQLGKRFALISQAELPTIGAYLGGIVAQEVIKAITNKYMPIKQFFTFHFEEMIQKLPELEADIEKLHIEKQIDFKNLKIVVGKQNALKIEQLKTFVIGAGAIGCQLLKNFAMINMGAKGEIVVTDPDHIETSNLSRQFLFRQKHVKKAKSATACATLLQLNPLLQGHIIAKLDKVCQQTEEIYSDKFFKSRNIVANALDNVRARQYMDKRCVQNKVPLFESGTLGPKGHVQVIVPYKTENYGSQNDPNEQAQIPHCTLKMFPEQTVHCIQWARDIFGKIFTLNPKALKKVLQAKDLKTLQGQQRQTVAKIIKYRPQSFDDCIAEAVRKFYICYRNNVRQLMYTYPVDMKTKDGKPFWQLPKRPPKQIDQLNEKDDNHSTFISSYAVLLAKVFGIPHPKDFRKAEGKAKIMEIARKVKVEDFVPSAQTSKQIEKQVEKQNSNVIEEPKPQQVVQNQKPAQKMLSEEIELNQQVLELKITPQQFEKDEDQNGHIDLIYSMSNLRCKNYGLNQCTWIQAKLKAGKIMAALSTTTSVVAALQTIEIIKLAVNCVIWRNAFINLAVPYVQISEPGPAAKHKIGNSQFTVWEDWSFKVSTLKQLLDQLHDKYQVQGYNISTAEGKPVYWEAMYLNKEQNKQTLLNKKLTEMFEQKHVQLNVAMRKPVTGENYQNVPKIKLEIV